MKFSEFLRYFEEDYFNQIIYMNEIYQLTCDNNREIYMSKDHLQDFRYGDAENIKELLKKDRARLNFYYYDNIQRIDYKFETAMDGEISISCYNPYEICKVLETINPLLEKYEIEGLMLISSKLESETYKVRLNGYNLKSEKLSDILQEIENKLSGVQR